VGFGDVDQTIKELMSLQVFMIVTYWIKGAKVLKETPHFKERLFLVQVEV
jgi:hypothetical protein